MQDGGLPLRWAVIGVIALAVAGITGGAAAASAYWIAGEAAPAVAAGVATGSPTLIGCAAKLHRMIARG